MKIFFNSSVTGSSVYKGNYEAIGNVLETTDHDLITPLFAASRDHIEKETAAETDTYYAKLMRWLKSADIFLFEVSYPSLGIGHEITMAFQFNKPVIALYTDGKRPYILDGAEADRLQILEYSMDDLESVVLGALDYAADQQDTRFNFFISPKHQNYLDWVSKTRKVPRAVFLRKLIEEDIRDNGEYGS